MRKHVVHVEQAGSSYDNLFIDLDPLDSGGFTLRLCKEIANSREAMKVPCTFGVEWAFPPRLS